MIRLTLGAEMFAYVKTLRVEGMDTREDFREKYLGEVRNRNVCNDQSRNPTNDWCYLIG